MGRKLSGEYDSVCHYCRCPVFAFGQGRAAHEASWDHIIPRHMGGSNQSWNRVTACMRCNNAKSNAWPDCPCIKCDAARDKFRLEYRKLFQSAVHRGLIPLDAEWGSGSGVDRELSEDVSEAVLDRMVEMGLLEERPVRLPEERRTKVDCDSSEPEIISGHPIVSDWVPGD